MAFTRINVDREVTDDLIAEMVPVAEAMKAAGKVDHIPDFASFVRTEFYDRALEMTQTASN